MENNGRFTAEEFSAMRQELCDAFMTIAHNMKEYVDQAKDLRVPCTRYEWVNRLHNYAFANHRIYQTNNQCIETVLGLCQKTYEVDVALFTNDLTYDKFLGEACNCGLLAYFLTLINEHKLFSKNANRMTYLWRDILKLYEPEVLKRMPQSEMAMLHQAQLMNMEYRIAMHSDQRVVLSMAKHAQRVLDFEDRFDSFTHEQVRADFLSAYFCLLTVNFMNSGVLSFDSVVSTMKRFERFRQSHPNAFTSFTNPSLKRYVEHNMHYYQDLIPMLSLNFYDFVDAEKQAWIDQKLREYVVHYDEPAAESYHFYAMAKKVLGDWSANEAFAICDRFYRTHAIRDVDASATQRMVLTFFANKTYLYLLSKTNKSAGEKRDRAIEVINDLLNSVRYCSNFSSKLSHMVYSFLTQESTRKLLTKDMRYEFIRGVARIAMVRTYAHTEMVKRISEAILQAVASFEPELLVGTMGIQSVSEVDAHALELDDYMTNAAMYHDIGKFSMISVVGNDYMKLSDGEFEMLKMHPQMGLRIVETDAELQKYSDAILRHHLWYNHQGGYPMEVAGTHTPYDFLINILQIADTLEAGSDFLGRSYKRRKTFRELLAELKAGAGTRYNPDIVAMMSENIVVYNTLDKLLTFGLEENYYNIYLDYFEKRR